VNNNWQTTNISVYGDWSAFMWRSSTGTNSVGVHNNNWYGLSGSGPDFWWGSTQYFTISGFETASGGSGNSVTTGLGGPSVFNTTAALSFTPGELTTAIAALTAVQSIAGIDSGTSSYGVSLPGARISSLITRFGAGDSPVTLPEYIVLGFALTRYDTTASNALLTRIEPIATTAFQWT